MSHPRPKPLLPGFGKRKRLKRIRITDWTLAHEPSPPREIPNVNDRRKARVR